MGYFKQKVSKEIFEKKYCLHGETHPEEVFFGVAKEISNAETTEEKKAEWEKKFYDEMSSGRLIPAGRILANARPDSPMKNFNNCFTIALDEDNIAGIYESLKEDALISKTGGGVGFNCSKIRYKDAPISSGGTSSGVISFLKVFDASAKVIHTGGGRRAAHIAILNVDHPDIEEFITCKQSDDTLSQFNISVGITDDFMRAVENDIDWDLMFEGEIIKTVKARYLYDLMMQNAFMNNEPGVLFLDTVERYNNGYWAFNVDRVNPCGEICMPSYSLCCLSAINLTKFVKNPFTDEAYFDFDEFEKNCFNRR